MTRRQPRVTSTLKLVAAFCAAWMLAACDTPATGAVEAPAPAELVRGPGIGPGSKSVSGDRAAAYFTAMCGAADKGRANLEAVALQNGFAQNSSTATYYHQKDDLSVKLSGTLCTIVFTSKDSPSRVIAALEATSAKLTVTTVRDMGIAEGRHLYGAGAQVKG